MGPVVAILLPRSLDSTQSIALVDWIRQTSSSPPQEQENGWLFWMEESPIYLSIQPAEAGNSEEDLRSIAHHFGWRPEEEIAVEAGCNQKEDHRWLGRVALELAERFGGLIDFCGRLQWIRASEEGSSGLPGKLVALPYEVESGQELTYHVGDPAFLRGWLQRPEFHMVK